MSARHRDLTVVHVAQPVDGGVARYVVDLVVAQRAAGVNSVVVSPSGWLAEETGRLDLPWRRWEAVRSPGPGVPAEALRLHRLIADIGPHVVHLHSSKAGLAGRIALHAGVPTVFSPHGWAWQAVDGALGAVSARWERVARRWTDALVCVSEAERAAGAARGVRLPPAGPDGRGAHVVRTGVDLTVFAPADRSAARRQLDLPRTSPLTVCVGRLDEQKGQELLIRAWPQVLRDSPSAALALVGSGRGRLRLEATVAELGLDRHVLFVGEVAAVAPWYAAADVVAFSSRWGEALPLTPLEAMGSGRSVVATDVAGIRETLGPGCGAIVEPSAQPLAAAIAERLCSPELAASEGAAARSWAQAHHDARRAHEQLTALCRTLAG